MFLSKRALKICSKFKGEHPCRSAISRQLYWNHSSAFVFRSIFLYIFRTYFPEISSEGLLFKPINCVKEVLLPVRLTIWLRKLCLFYIICKNKSPFYLYDLTVDNTKLSITRTNQIKNVSNITRCNFFKSFFFLLQ